MTENTSGDIPIPVEEEKRFVREDVTRNLQRSRCVGHSLKNGKLSDHNQGFADQTRDGVNVRINPNGC